MAISIVVDDTPLKSVKTDMDTSKGKEPCKTVGDLFRVNNVTYDPKIDLLYVDDLEARANVFNIQLGRARSIEIIRGAKTDIRTGSSSSKDAKAIQEIIGRRNQGIQVKTLARNVKKVAAVSARKK